VDGVPEVQGRDVHRDSVWDVEGETLDGQLTQRSLQNAPFALHADGVAGEHHGDLHPDLSLQGDLEEIGVERAPLDRVQLQFLQDHRAGLPLPAPGQGEVDQHVLAGAEGREEILRLDRYGDRAPGAAVDHPGDALRLA